MFRTVKTRWLTVALLAAVVGFLQPASLLGQGDEAGRKIKTKVQPTYPELAKRISLSGTVKIQVTVSATGVPKSTKAVGGNPVLIEAAVDALKKWRWEPGSETTEVIEFHFIPQ